LRVLQEKEVLPVGATQPVPIDVRVVAATHRDLARAIATGGFREDLYGRLCTWEIRVPPLRERRVDLLPWIERLHAPWAAARNTQASLKFDADAAEQILRATWPLNLRGVERLVHELGVRDAPQDLIARSKLPSWLASGVVSTVPVGREGNQEPTVPTVPTRDEFVLAFEQVQGSVHALAKRFDRDRRQIYRWIEAHGLSDRRTKKDGPS
jgi:two-component system response regulator GlrR